MVLTDKICSCILYSAHSPSPSVSLFSFSALCSTHSVNPSSSLAPGSESGGPRVPKEAGPRVPEEARPRAGGRGQSRGAAVGPALRPQPGEGVEERGEVLTKRVGREGRVGHRRRRRWGASEVTPAGREGGRMQGVKLHLL